MPLSRPEPFEVTPPSDRQIVFRVIASGDATPLAFLSDEADDRMPSVRRGVSMAIFRGFSVRNTLPQAQSLARRMPGTRYVAEVELHWGDGDAIARTFATRGHHTVWAHPQLIAERVRAIHPV